MRNDRLDTCASRHVALFCPYFADEAFPLYFFLFIYVWILNFNFNFNFCLMDYWIIELVGY